IDVVINAGQAGTAMSGGSNWNDPEVVSIIRQWVHEGHGFVGVGEPSAYDKSGKFFQLADILGVERERGLTLSSNKYFYTAMDKHFITEDKTRPFESGEPVTNIYATHKETEVIDIQDQNVTIAANP
ncbi:lacto-N-biose phosphorylase central domain-containing protein, partial [Erysipelothrix aquatica]